MSVCLETSGNQVSSTTTTALQSADGSTTTAPSLTAPSLTAPSLTAVSTTQPGQQQSVSKLPQGLPKASLITVLNAPLGNVKTLCLTPAVSSNASGQFTVVNSATPLNVSNSTAVKPQTITLINTPVTVVKTISPGNVEKSDINNPATVVENRAHNVFVKNTCSSTDGADSSQSHKLLTANNFPTTTVVGAADCQKTPNGQRSGGSGGKVKIISNVVVPGTSQNTANLLLKQQQQQQQQQQQRYVPRQKVIGPNNGAKYPSKPPNNLNNRSMLTKGAPPAQKLLYPTHKSQIKTLPPINSYVHNKGQGIKTLSPHPQVTKVPGGGQVVQQRAGGGGLRTIPPQRAPPPQKLAANKPNYIGKHAVQAQKMKPKLKGAKVAPPVASAGNYNSFAPQERSQLTFNQALTAEILETLGTKSNSGYHVHHHHQQQQQQQTVGKSFEVMPTRYDNAYYTPEAKQLFGMDVKPMEEQRTKSGLDALSLICQAVLLDHNYNATLPPDSSPNRLVAQSSTPSQINGVANIYSPGSGKRRTLSGSNPVSCTTSLSNLSVVPSVGNSICLQDDDDAASDISDGSDRKHDTEGEETDTAPEAEAVNNEDQFGDYVTRCICGFIHDDGYMIECDRCKVWQHVQCVVKNKQVPEDYLCEVCDPRKHVDRQKARATQQQWLRDRQFAASNSAASDSKSAKKDAKSFKDVVMSDSDSSDGEHCPNNNVKSGGGRPASINRQRKGETGKGTRQRRDVVKEAVQRRQIKKRERKVVKRKPKSVASKAQSDDEPLRHHHDGISHLPQLRQWIENYEEAVTNHYSPELRARIGAIRVNGAHSDVDGDFDPSVHKCRVHTQPLTEMRFLMSGVKLEPHSPVIELRGKYMLSIQHRNAGGALNTRQHAQRPGPFLFFYRLHKDNTEVCVDTRTYGNSARFVRRSCKPNAELRHSIVKGVLHLYIVTIADVDKNVELTIKHESHDLAAIGTTHIACACGNPDECTVNRSGSTVKKNGDVVEMFKKRRGRRTASLSSPNDSDVGRSRKDVSAPPPPPPPLPSPVLATAIKSDLDEIKQIKQEKTEIKVEIEETLATKIEVKDEEVVDEEVKKCDDEEDDEDKPKLDSKSDVKVEEEIQTPSSPVAPPPPVITTRRTSSHHKMAAAAQAAILSDKDDSRDGPGDVGKDESNHSSPGESKSSKNKKLSREERKLEAILRAIEQMEKADQRKQEHQAKQAHRRESEPGPGKEEDKMEPKIKRKRRKGRARAQSTQSNRRNRLNSTDSYMTSGDETLLLSPNDNPHPRRLSMRDSSSDYKENSLCDSNATDNKDVGLLLALSKGGDKLNKSPARDVDSNSNSAQSSPETHLSSACLLVQAAVEPMEAAGFKFPKTKKGLMNEWLNKVPEQPPVQSASLISPSALQPHIVNSDYDLTYTAPSKGLATYCDSSTVQPRGSAKKRWLRQAISEDQCDSPSSRPDSPPLSETVAPPKKRRLPRESLSNDITPPTTPTSLAAPSIINNNNTSERPTPLPVAPVVSLVEEIADEDSSPAQIVEEVPLEESANESKEEAKGSSGSMAQSSSSSQSDSPMQTVGMLLDPRLTRDHHPHHHIFTSSEHLVGTVEKTLSILGFEDKRPEPITPAKRKLSITEYRQRKKLNNNDKCLDESESAGNEEMCSSDHSKPSRPRSDSTSSCTSMTSSDEEVVPTIMEIQAPSAFNSEPTELERQREITSLRLKKAFGIPVDEEARKPALDVDAILNCDLPSVARSIPPSPNFPIPGSCEVNLPPHQSTSTVDPLVGAPPPSKSPPPPEESKEQGDDDDDDDEGEHGEKQLEPTRVVWEEKVTKPIPFYTPDEEDKLEGEVEEKEDDDEEEDVLMTETMETVDYVPPFNNPIYPNDADYGASVIDEEGRYEGRNPSPPPDLGLDET